MSDFWEPFWMTVFRYTNTSVSLRNNNCIVTESQQKNEDLYKFVLESVAYFLFNITYKHEMFLFKYN